VATTSAISWAPTLGGANGTMDDAVVDIPWPAVVQREYLTLPQRHARDDARIY
jgi:hypothetical protein